MVALADFTSYHLGLMLTDLEAELRLRPEAPALQNLWTAFGTHMPWDQRFTRCWDDPAFAARYTWLKGRIDTAVGLDSKTTLAVALPALRNILAAREAEEGSPF